MSNLTEIAYYTRKTLKYGTIFLLVFLVLRQIFILVYPYIVPPPAPPPPTQAFGKISAISFPKNAANPSFYPRLETINNKLPEFPLTAKVYFISPKSPNLFTWERAKNWAKQLGFTEEPESTDVYNYVFKNLGFPSTVLKMNVITGNFSFNYNYQNDLTLSGSRNAPQKEQAITEAKSFLQRANAFSADLAAGTQETIYFRFIPPDLEPAVSLSEADLVLVNFFRANLDEIKVMPPDPKKSLVSVLISGSNDPQRRILQVNFTHFPIEETTYATYPLKTIDQAWQELQKNEGYLASFGQNYDGQVVIRKVYLAYYDLPDEQRFLQPVYVFEGDRDFIGYVPALDPKAVSSQTPEETPK